MATADITEGWRTVLEQLNPRDKAIFREARPELREGMLVLSFRYSWHFKSAPAHAAGLEPLVAAWLGPEITLQFVEDPTGEGPAQAGRGQPSPEEHPIVQAAVRKLEGKVTRVREV